jgi:hypothetical protein
MNRVENRATVRRADTTAGAVPSGGPPRATHSSRLPARFRRGRTDRSRPLGSGDRLLWELPRGRLASGTLAPRRPVLGPIWISDRRRRCTVIDDLTGTADADRAPAPELFFDR